MTPEALDPRGAVIQSYFQAAPKRPRVTVELLIAGGGLILCLLGLSFAGTASSYGDPSGCGGCAGGAMLGLGAALGAAGLVPLAIKLSTYRAALLRERSTAEDTRIQQFLEGGLARIQSHGLLTLGIDREELVAEPLLITGPVLWQTAGIPDPDLRWRAGADEVMRFGVYRVGVVALTATRLAAYCGDYNFIQDRVVNEATHEYHYRDIVAVSTGEFPSSLRLPGGERLTRARDFRLSVASGESIRITLDSPEMRQRLGMARMPETGAEQAVQAIRTMLREKKS